VTFAPWRTRSVPSGTVALNVRELGSLDDPTVVLVHGYPDASAVWDDVAIELAGTGHHVVTYDVRGMGRSSAPTGPHPYRLDRLGDDLFAVLDAVSPDRPAHVVGHDWGSIQSWEAVTDDARSHRIASYTSMSGPCLDHVGHALRRQARRRGDGTTAMVLRQALRSTYIGFLHTPVLSTAIWRLGADRSFRRFLRRVEGVVDDGRHATLAADGRAGVHLYRANIGPRLLRPRERRTQVPVLLVTLTEDRYVTPVLLDGLEAWAPDLTRRTLTARHWAPRTHPSEVAALVAEHVATVEATGSAHRDLTG
jgi:pimeloyl-ACP methyl ester carboxylesterase